MILRISGVQVLDGLSPALQPGPVVVEDDRILGTGPSATRPAQAQEIDFAHVPHATVLPGLIDSYLHLAISGANQLEKADPDPLVALRMAHHAAENLRAGITTVRDMGAKRHIDVQFRRARQLGLVPGPRVLISGQPIIATGGHTYYMGREIDGPDEATKGAREQLKAGVDWLKMMVTGGVMTPGMDPRDQQMTRDEIAAVVAAGHRAGRRVAAHAQGGPGVRDAIEAGIDSLEHGLYLGPEEIDLLATRGTYYVPTLSAFVLIAEGVEVAAVRPPRDAIEKAKAAVEGHTRSFDLARRAGIKIVAGTDYRHGSLPYELALMVRYGLPPLDAVWAATSRAAEMLRLDGQLGSLTPGKVADLIVVEGNPLDDISVLTRVRLVVQGGQVVARDGALLDRAES